MWLRIIIRHEGTMGWKSWPRPGTACLLLFSLFLPSWLLFCWSETVESKRMHACPFMKPEYSKEQSSEKSNIGKNEGWFCFVVPDSGFV